MKVIKLGLLAYTARAQEEGASSRSPVLDEVEVLEQGSPRDIVLDDGDDEEIEDPNDLDNPDNPILDDFIEFEPTDIDFSEMSFYRGARKNDNQPSQISPMGPEDYCTVNPSSGSRKSGNAYQLDDNCNDPTTFGQIGHKCTISCISEEADLYYVSENREGEFEYNLVNRPNVKLECVRQGSGGLGWNVDYNYFTLRCLAANSKALARPPPVPVQFPVVSEPVGVEDAVDASLTLDITD